MTETPEVVGAVGSSSNRGLSPCFTNPRLIQTTKLTVPTGFVGSRCTGGGGQEGLRSLQFLVDGLQGPDLKLSGAVRRRNLDAVTHALSHQAASDGRRSRDQTLAQVRLLGGHEFVFNLSAAVEVVQDDFGAESRVARTGALSVRGSSWE